MQEPSTSHELFKCLRCENKHKRFTDSKKKVVEHILEYHVPEDKIPFSCKLCQFRSTDQEALINHVNWFKRHIEAAKRQADGNYIQHMVFSKNPIKIDHKYLAPLNERKSSYNDVAKTNTEIGHKGVSVSMMSPNKPVMSQQYLHQTAPLYREGISYGSRDDTQEPPNKKRPSPLVTQRQHSATEFNITEAERASSRGGEMSVVETIQTCCKSIVEAIQAHDKTLKGVVKELELLNGKVQRRRTSGTDDVDSNIGQVKKPTPK